MLWYQSWRIPTCNVSRFDNVISSWPKKAARSASLRES
jgi:hypothetical protein